MTVAEAMIANARKTLTDLGQSGPLRFSDYHLGCYIEQGDKRLPIWCDEFTAAAIKKAIDNAA